MRVASAQMNETAPAGVQLVPRFERKFFVLPRNIGFAYTLLRQVCRPDSEYPEGEVLGEYPGGLFTFESLTPAQKEILQTIMQYAMPKMGLPGQAFGQAPAGTTAGAGMGAGMGQGGPAQAMMPMLSGLLGGGGQPPRGGGR